MVAFGFLPQIFGRWRGRTNGPFMNAGSLVGITEGGGNTRTLTYAK